LIKDNNYNFFDLNYIIFAHYVSSILIDLYQFVIIHCVA